jgi:pimeloyl-ACP methyl ester carboxylesterase
VRELVLVGHSMGGLVIRSACAQAAERGHGWTGPLAHVVYLGTPHLGAPLERAVHRGVGLFGRIPEVAPFTAILDRRSPGIRDLRHGRLLDDPALAAPVPDAPWLADVDHHLVVGRLTRSEHHPVTRLLGDLLVSAPSATGQGRRRRIDGERVHVRAVHANHFGLCWHPDVAAHLRAHLADGTRAADSA